MGLSCYLLLLCFSVSANVVSTMNSDGKALLSLVKHWRDVPSLLQLSWKDSDSSPCLWAGVECDQKNQSVVALNLSGYGISGQLGPEIAYLKLLKSVDLSINSFSGSIPSELGNCSLLEYLDLSGNSFTGELPERLRNLKNLRYVNLRSNSLNGTLPESLFWIPSLNTIYLNNNEFTGTIPSNIGNCSALQELHLSGNYLSGKIPAALGTCKSLVYLRMEQNQLEGHIPPEIGKLVSLQALNLSQNCLNGEMPSELSNCRKLLHLDLSHNFLNGSISPTLSSLTALTTLTLSQNRLTGDIPTSLFELHKLSKLQLGGNMLGGNIPSTIGSLGVIQNLKFLNLSSNMLMGEVPIQMRGLTMLERIDISCNNLSGSLRFLHDIQSLVFINVSYNHFSGPIPSSLLKFRNLSPSPFAGNPGLVVECFALNCIGNSHSKSSNYQPSKKNGHRRTKIVIIVLGSSFPLGLLVVAFIKMRQQGRRFESKDLIEPAFLRDVVCSHPDILKVTHNLHDMYILGKGGQGTVYKVTLSPDTVFAAKKYQFTGKSGSRSMIREIQTIGKIRHRNLIQFLGSWSGENYGLVLYPYMENGSLHDLLHERKPQILLDWNIRYKIALGMAHGLSYLHFDCTPPVLHRDIKPKNILLDNEFEPHISDFGLATLLDGNAALSPTLIGTGGYIAPGKIMHVY